MVSTDPSQGGPGGTDSLAGQVIDPDEYTRSWCTPESHLSVEGEKAPSGQVPYLLLVISATLRSSGSVLLVTSRASVDTDLKARMAVIR